jgi:hypothetical protein
MSINPSLAESEVATGAPTTVMEYGCDGGGETIFAHQRDGVWLYWSEGSAGGMGDEWDDPVVSWQKEPREDLGSLLPEWFYFAHPLLINPQFLDQVLDLWRQSRAKADFQDEHLSEDRWRWEADRWPQKIAEGRLPTSKRAQTEAA